MCSNPTLGQQVRAAVLRPPAAQRDRLRDTTHAADGGNVGNAHDLAHARAALGVLTGVGGEAAGLPASSGAYSPRSTSFCRKITGHGLANSPPARREI